MRFLTPKPMEGAVHLAGELRMAGDLKAVKVRIEGPLVLSQAQLFPPTIAVENNSDQSLTVEISPASLALNGMPPTVVISRAKKDCRPLRWLDTWSVVLPARIKNEELGDYIEDIRRRAAQGQRILAWLRLIFAAFWTGVNAVGYLLKELGNRKAA